MKSTTMLSQITTQEDVLFAGITVKQLAIWMFGGIVSIGIYFIVPHSLSLSPIKAALMGIVAVVTIVSTVRYKGAMLCERWLLRLAYTLRPTIATE